MGVATRHFAGAFLRHGDEVLLMRRGLHKQIAPGLWAGIGGHIEAHEMASPEAACLREITEETGIAPASVLGLKLRYFTLCKTADTLDSIYYFAGTLDARHALIDTDEGTLHWVGLSDALALPMAPHMRAMLRHWVDNPDADGLHCCLVGTDGGVCMADIRLP